MLFGGAIAFGRISNHALIALVASSGFLFLNVFLVNYGENH